MRELRNSLGLYRFPIIAIAIAGGLLLFVPFLVMLSTSFTSGVFISFPPEGFSLQWYAEVVADRRWTRPFWLSIGLSCVATAIAVIIGVAGALGLARITNPAAARSLRTLFIVPVALPPIAYAVGLYGVNARSGPFGDTLGALILGEALIALPYVFVLVSAALSRMDPALRSAASTMGAPWPMILWRVELPILFPNIIAGAVFAFIIVFDEVVLSLFLLPAGQSTLPLKMLDASREAFSPELSAASSLVSLMALVVLGIATLPWARWADARKLARSVESTSSSDRDTRKAAAS